MIRRNKIIASVAVSVMTGVLVAGNLVPLQGYYAFAQETGVTAMRYSAVKDINKTLEGYTPIDTRMSSPRQKNFIFFQRKFGDISRAFLCLNQESP